MNLKRLNNSFILFIVFPLIMKCSSSSETSKDVKLNSEIVDKILDQNGNNIALLSCLRCGCFVDVYNKQFKEKGKHPTGYVLFADTLCNKFLFPVKHLPSKNIEEISDEIYNLTLIKRRNNIIITKILQAEDSKNLNLLLDKFFEK